MGQATAAAQRERTTAGDEQREYAGLPRESSKSVELDGGGATARFANGHAPRTRPPAQGVPGAATGKVLGVNNVQFIQGILNFEWGGGVVICALALYLMRNTIICRKFSFYYQSQ